ANFRDMTQSGVIQMLVERWKKLCARFLFRSGVGAMHAHPCFNKWANQPGPDSALMITAVAFGYAPAIMRRVSRFTRGERAQTDRREQKLLYRIYNMTRLFFREQRERQSSNSEDLIRSKCKIDNARLMIAIDDVGEVTSVFAPEFAFERRASFLEHRLPTRGKFRGNRKRVYPQRLNFHRHPNSWRDLPSLNSRIHPVELLTGFASWDQSVAMGTNAGAGRFIIAS